MARKPRGRVRPGPSRSRRQKPTQVRRRLRPRPPAPRPKPTPPEPPKVEVPARKSTYIEAVAIYERGVEALQRRDFAKAAERFREVQLRYPEERELHDRARLYLRVCERELDRRESGPQTVEERIYAGTLALNAGADEDALMHLTRAVAEDPESGNAHYMLAVVYARRRSPEAAVTHLRQAIQLDPETRALARREPDFDAIRDHETFRQVVETPGGPGASRRRVRGRSTG